ncbi:coiled-coil domain-containing protein 130 homolog [Chironomus tepperi]|uniref:coiled-coil domain-containing protein 130 homolog n=1 Tax=Chironomus tepperi TaxID=113505 RepID=UPI00391F2F8D
MGERKGQNKYYPPDYFNNPKVMAKGLDAYHGHHRLRERGKKAHIGILVIRFEMPYNIWCEGCKNHIGMGVRYNAEKQKVGNYYSTPIYEFKMKCHLCENYFVIKTDPANLDYTIISGARRQENRWDPTQNEQIVPETKETQRRLFDDAMYKLEHGLKDQKASADAKPAICRLYQRNDDVWKDNFEANLKLRAQFRKSKKEAKAAEDADNKILSRTSLVGLSLLPENEEDRQLASLLKLHSTKSIQDKSREKFKEIMEKPALPSATIVSSFYGMKKEKLLSQKPAILGIVKKKEVDQEPVEKKQKIEPVTSLVAAYSSSSEEEN